VSRPRPFCPFLTTGHGLILPSIVSCLDDARHIAPAGHMLKDGTFYEDLGAAHFDRRRPETQARRLVKRLADLGFSVELKPVAVLS
jgi:hypothetical protein